MCITIAQEESHVWHVAACNVPGAALETCLMTFFFFGPVRTVARPRKDLIPDILSLVLLLAGCETF